MHLVYPDRGSASASPTHHDPVEIQACYANLGASPVKPGSVRQQRTSTVQPGKSIFATAHSINLRFYAPEFVSPIALCASIYWATAREARRMGECVRTRPGFGLNLIILACLSSLALSQPAFRSGQRSTFRVCREAPQRPPKCRSAKPFREPRDHSRPFRRVRCNGRPDCAGVQT
jgi:hypothetical protein